MFGCTCRLFGLLGTAAEELSVRELLRSLVCWAKSVICNSLQGFCVRFEGEGDLIGFLQPTSQLDMVIEPELAFQLLILIYTLIDTLGIV